MKSPWFFVAIAAVIIGGGLFACAKSGSGFIKAIEHSAQAATASTNPIVTISAATDFEWDKLFIFAPYTSVDKIHEQLGYKWNEAEKTHIDSSEFHLLVFVKNGKVVRHFRVSRRIDFQNLEAGNVFTPGDDTFEVKSVGAGETTRLNLFPKHKGQPNSK